MPMLLILMVGQASCTGANAYSQGQRFTQASPEIADWDQAVRLACAAAGYGLDDWL